MYCGCIEWAKSRSRGGQLLRACPRGSGRSAPPSDVRAMESLQWHWMAESCGRGGSAPTLLLRIDGVRRWRYDGALGPERAAPRLRLRQSLVPARHGNICSGLLRRALASQATLPEDKALRFLPGTVIGRRNAAAGRGPRDFKQRRRISRGARGSGTGGPCAPALRPACARGGGFRSPPLRTAHHPSATTCMQPLKARAVGTQLSIGGTSQQPCARARRGFLQQPRKRQESLMRGTRRPA